MKFLSSFFILTHLFLAVSGQAWQQLNSPTSKNIKSSSFINDLTGWIGIQNNSSDAKLFRTTDGGTTWDTFTIANAAGGTTYIEFANESTGYAVVNGEAFKTTNGGVSWSQLTLPGTPYYEPCFLNPDTGFISGDGAVYKTINGGVSWVTSNGITSQPFFNIRFLNEAVGVASEYDGYIWTTDDGGLNWNFSNYGDLWSYFFSVGFQPDGDLLYTGYTVSPGDEGVWVGGTTYFSDAIDYLYDVKAFDNYRLYAVGENGVVISSSNSGNICQENSISTVTLNVVDGLNDIYAFGNDGKAYKLLYTCTTSSVFSSTINYLDAQFSDGSLNADAWSWDFGDGQTSTLQNPAHTYSSAGNYNVCLTVSSDSCGSDTFCDQVTACVPNTSLMPEGSLDSTFDGDGIFITPVGEEGIPYDIEIQSDGKILTAFGYYLARFNADGSPDYSFDNDGQIRLESLISYQFKPQKIALTSSQQIIVAGISNQTDLAIAKLNPDASFDLSFNSYGWLSNNISNGQKQNYVFDVIPLPEGKVLAAGTYFTGEIGIERINIDGTIDVTFADNGETHINPPGDATYTGTMAMQADGKIIIGATKDLDDKKFEIIRLDSNGKPDSAFGGDGIAVTNLSTGSDNKDYVEGILVQPDGKIIAIGTAKANDDDNLNANFALTRYNADGTLDASFNGNGIDIFQVNGLAGKGQAAVMQPDGKILIVGYVYDENSPNRIALVRLNTDGTFDASFGNNGWVITSINCEKTVPGSIALDNDKIYVGGSHTLYNNQCILRYVNTDCSYASADFSFFSDQLIVQFTDQSVNATSWSWDFGDGTVSNDQNPVHAYALPGIYVACLVSGNDCGSDTSCQSISVIATSTDQSQIATLEFTIFPNPFYSETTIRFSLLKNSDIQIKLQDLLGRKIKTVADGNFDAGNHQLNFSKENLDAGIYLLQLKTDSGKSIKKLIIQ